MWGDDIRRAREAAGLSQAELARRSGVNRRLLNRIEKNDNVTVETLAKLLPHLPALHALTVYGSRSIEIHAAPADLDEARRIARRLREDVDRLEGKLRGPSDELGVAQKMERLTEDVFSLPPDKLLDFFGHIAARVNSTPTRESLLRTPAGSRRKLIAQAATIDGLTSVKPRTKANPKTKKG